MVQSKSAYDRDNFILVVDDDNTLLKFFKIHLNKFFSKVIVVKNAKEAIEALREKEIDLLISDINMPRMDGFDLMKRVRKKDSAIPVLLISGALLSQEEEEFVKAADGYLRKPFDIDDLHCFIKNGLERREKMKALAEFITDKKKLRHLLEGTVNIEKIVKKDKLDDAKNALADLSKLS